MQDSEIIRLLSEATLKSHEAHWALISRGQNKEPWTGEGLPPVGTVCEFYADEDTWRECKIVGENEGYLIVWVTHAHIWTTKAAALLRPIRTPEQIAAEKREADIEELRVLLSNVACDDYQAAVATIDAGYHK